jgi:hypothetical protein
MARGHRQSNIIGAGMGVSIARRSDEPHGNPIVSSAAPRQSAEWPWLTGTFGTLLSPSTVVRRDEHAELLSRVQILGATGEAIGASPPCHEVTSISSPTFPSGGSYLIRVAQATIRHFLERLVGRLETELVRVV